MNVLVIFRELTDLLESLSLKDTFVFNGNEIYQLYFFLIPLFVNLSLSNLLAKEKNLDSISTILISMVCFFRVSGFLRIDDSTQLVSSNGSILTSILCTWIAIALLQYFSKIPQFRFIPHQGNINPRLRNTLNLTLPALLTVVSFEAIGQFLGWIANIDINMIQTSQMSAIQEIILYKLISLFTWYFGLHGEHSADGIFRLINNIPSTQVYSIQLKSFHDLFMNIGGAGSTFIVPFLILLNKSTTPFKSIAQLSLIFSFFNVNEILLFGLPILLNPLFAIPFILAPFVNMAIALTAIHFGAFSISLHPIHWMLPPIYSAYVATDGSVWAMVTQLFCIITDGLIYFPFLVLASRQYYTPLHLLKLFGEDAYSFINEEIDRQQERLFLAKQKSAMNDMTAAQKILRQFQGGRFILYFQPKVDASSLKLLGLEALLRFEDSKGKIVPPTFLPILYQQGLSKVIDKKVVSMAFSQILKWRRMGLQVPPIAINFDKEFLLDRKAIKEFISQANKNKTRFYIEITEHTYTVEWKTLQLVIRELRSAGHRISIDDFGAGYSSLNSLLVLEADEIKLDRKLVIAHEIDAERGRMLLASTIQLCHDLGFLVVAEGVETFFQLQLLQSYGVEVIQGYYVGKPMPSDEVCQLFIS
ncbi:EAL domain-containing protein [Roseofilum casamattae]|uniref:EAL domain-containing protein n=1 Tax=Roseofilum casamattae BLCC-M143 TaxID=3022442 RepID=A0ABT7C0Q2_9CYAN|nr:EAL domain-containing protein [Roseofilum casamattae]MDJ1184642.1 EAL domain-containing protein [Roseofilum casamattae BLCC-M143]